MSIFFSVSAIASLVSGLVAICRERYGSKDITMEIQQSGSPQKSKRTNYHHIKHENKQV